jgi:VIT1/CCC1 family predicted Fe2+/Mn2+ transporter
MTGAGQPGACLVRLGPTATHHEGDERGLAFYLRDLILGGQDGLVNVLGLVLGLTAAGSEARTIVIGGLAALLAESVAMAGVIYTSAAAERDYYESKLEQERREIREIPDAEREEVRDIFRERGLEGELLDRVVAYVTADPERWVDTMMRDELHLEKPEAAGITRAVLVGLSCAVGSAIPIVPYLVIAPSNAALIALISSAAVLFGVGVYKAVTLVGSWWRSGLQMLVIGMASALAGYAIGVLLGAR